MTTILTRGPQQASGLLFDLVRAYYQEVFETPERLSEALWATYAGDLPPVHVAASAAALGIAELYARSQRCPAPWFGVVHLYAMRMEIPGRRACPIKIGVSNNPPQRAAGIRTGSPYPIRLLGAIPEVIARESVLHHEFRRVRLQGEWFRATPRVVAFADALARLSALYQNVPLLGPSLCFTESDLGRQAMADYEQQARRSSVEGRIAWREIRCQAHVWRSRFRSQCMNAALATVEGHHVCEIHRLAIGRGDVVLLTDRDVPPPYSRLAGDAWGCP